MTFASWLLWGFVGTVVLTAVLSIAYSLRLTRVHLPFLLGTMFTADRDRAKLWGAAVHLLNGWLFAFVYVAAFEAWGAAGVARGMLIGFVHVAFVLGVGMPLMPSLHPRMAAETHGPDPPRMLEPPGFCAIHYGYQTPIAVLCAHLLYGGILGAFYHLSSG